MRVSGLASCDTGKFTCDGFSKDHRTRRPQKSDARSVRLGAIATIDRGAHLSRHIAGLNDVLYPDRNAVQRPVLWIRVKRFRSPENQIVVDERPSLDYWVARLDAGKASPGDLLAPQLACRGSTDDFSSG